jgi:hypothetical protein
MLRSVKQAKKTNKQKRTAGVLPLCGLLALSGPAYGATLYFLSVKQAVSGDCPIVLDLNGNGQIDVSGFTTAQRQVYTVFSIPSFVEFDLRGDGEKQKIDWVLPNTDGFLLDLRKGNPPREINGHWLFANTEGFENGFQKLAEFDKDNDANISGDELQQLALWVDDGDGLYNPSELRRLSDYGIISLPTVHSTEEAAYGGEKMIGYAYTSSEKEIYMEDVWFLNEFDLFDFDREFSALWR